MNGICRASKTSKRKQYKFIFVTTQHACSTRVTVAVFCVSVWIRVYVISFLPPHVYRPQNIGIQIYHDTGKTFTALIFAKNAYFRRNGVICFLESHQLHLTHQRRIQTESTQHGHDISIGILTKNSSFTSYGTFAYFP